MNELKYLSQFEKYKQISKGMSGDEKYHCIKDGKEFLLRISAVDKYEDIKVEFERLRRMNSANLPVPEAIDLFQSDDRTKIFTLLSWMTGEEVDKVLPRMNIREQYEYGFQAGDILHKIHENSTVSESPPGWYERYFEVIQPRLDAYRRERIPFEGSENVFKFLDENKQLLSTRPIIRMHGDYHTGNLIVNEGKLYVIDWHVVDFDNLGDPWYEFNRLAIEYPSYAKGQIDSYFRHNVPDEFWKLFAFYLSSSAITSIVWAKYWAPDELENIMELNRSVLKMFDNMENPIPQWYRDLNG